MEMPAFFFWPPADADEGGPGASESAGGCFAL